MLGEIYTNILNGVSYASILFLIASGLSLVLGIMGVLNLSHGALYMLGAYIGISASNHFNNFLVGAILAAVGIGIIGFVMEKFLLSRLYKNFDQQALLTLGLVYIFANVVLWIWGPWPQMGSAPAILSGSISLENFRFSVYRLGIIIIGLAIFIGLWWLQDKTRIGARIRAGMDNKEMTGGLGINYGLISTCVFILGAAMGGLAGFLGSPVTGAFPEMSMQILLLAMIIVVVGGLGKVQGAMLGSLIVGLIDTFGKAYFPFFSSFTVYLIFVIILIVKPTGLWGKKRI
jgi:branched-chain amino acid transport system permease protein